MTIHTSQPLTCAYNIVAGRNTYDHQYVPANYVSHQTYYDYPQVSVNYLNIVAITHMTPRKSQPLTYNIVAHDTYDHPQVPTT